MKHRVFVAGHRGLAGSATVRALASEPDWFEVITAPRNEVDLEDAARTDEFFHRARPDMVVMCAAKVGGILANATMPVDFLHQNLRIQLNVLEAAYRTGVKRLIFLGSSCIYPRDCAQPIKEDYLLTGPLESTNRPYAIAKIAGVESCWSYNRQHGTQYLALMPTNMYGPGDNYHPEHSHVLPALIRRFHEAKETNQERVVVWGSGQPRREFMFSDDLGSAIKFLLSLPADRFSRLTDVARAPLVNIGVGEDITIRELAELIRQVVGYGGRLEFDRSKPDGTPRKLLDVSRINELGWKAQTTLRHGIEAAYKDFMTSTPRG